LSGPQIGLATGKFYLKFGLRDRHLPGRLLAPIGRRLLHKGRPLQHTVAICDTDFAFGLC